MKYPQLVHIPRDVEQWLEKQIEARGFEGVICAKYILISLLQIGAISAMECVSGNCHCHDDYRNKKKYQAYYDRQSWDFELFKHFGVVPCSLSTLKQKCDIEKLIDELCFKLKETEKKKTSSFNVPTTREASLFTNPPPTYSNASLSGTFIGPNEALPAPTYNPIWTRGLLHDSQLLKDQAKMEDYFSSLFYDNPSDNFGLEFTRIKSDERQDGKERDRISFYNKQNLLASECTERLYERNADVDKLIAKFDANIEGIWKPFDGLGGFKYENLLPENILTNSYFEGRSNLIWSFGQNGNDWLKQEKFENENCNKPNSQNWSKVSSPVLPSSSNFGINAMLTSLNLTLSNVQKWSAVDGQSKGSNSFLNHKSQGSCFAEVIPKSMAPNLGFHSQIPLERQRANGEEEDLLTSAKTHFRPIRMEEIQPNQTAYADGTTFAISNELEKVTFTRSNSGVLYLDSEGELATPRKYMEYKEKEINTKMFDSGSDLSVMEEFIPKFRVRQSNEKCCQTEDVTEEDQIVPSLNETDCDSDSFECDGDGFFFPGDRELAENMVAKMEDEGKLVKSDYNYNDIYVTNNVDLESLRKITNNGQCVCSNGKAWLPSTEFDIRQGWSVWNAETVCQGCKGLGFPTEDEYYRFREELTQEGEQLLSDLSCLQQLYSNSKWCDDESGTVSDVNDDDVFCSSELLNKLRSSKDEDDWKNCLIERDEISNLNSNESSMLKDGKAQNISSKLIEICDRPFIIERLSKERKRRNSSSQKISSLFADGQGHRNYYRFSLCDSVNPSLLFDTGRIGRGLSEISKSLKRPFSF